MPIRRASSAFLQITCKERFVLQTTPSHASIPSNQMARWPKTDKWGGKMYKGKHSLLNDIKRQRSCGCVNSFRLWLPRRDDHSGALIGAGGERRSDWPAHVLDNDVSTRHDRYWACEERSIARYHTLSLICLSASL